jgi:Na+/H+ antiporter NhaC
MLQSTLQKVKEQYTTKKRHIKHNFTIFYKSICLIMFSWCFCGFSQAKEHNNVQSWNIAATWHKIMMTDYLAFNVW